MGNIKVSIIVCSYNQEKYIRQTIESIINQEHPYTWELIVCDDASKDSTPAIIAEYAEKHPEIIPVLRKENLGMVKNFFDGISRCRGEYIMACGGDDYYLPGKIKSQVEYLDAHQDVGLIHGDVNIIDDYGHHNHDGIGKGDSMDSITNYLKSYQIYAVTIALRHIDLSAYIREVNPVDQNWLMEDLPLLIWFKLHNKLAYVPGKVADYRIVSNSISHPVKSIKVLNFRKSEFDVTQFYQQNYPALLSAELIIDIHVKRLINDDVIIKNHSDYCFKILDQWKEYNSNIKYQIFKMRIRYPIINKIYLSTAKTVSKIIHCTI